MELFVEFGCELINGRYDQQGIKVQVIIFEGLSSSVAFML